MTRVYLSIDVAGLRELQSGAPIVRDQYLPASEDEEDELAALEEAAEMGPAALAAEVDAADDPVSLDQVASFHVPLDDSGHLAWYATQEIDTVIDLLS